MSNKVRRNYSETRYVGDLDLDAERELIAREQGDLQLAEVYAKRKEGEE